MDAAPLQCDQVSALAALDDLHVVVAGAPWSV